MSSGNLVSSSRGDPEGCFQVPAPLRFFLRAVRGAGISARNWTLGSELGPRPSVRPIAALLSLLCVTGSALSGQDVGYGAYSYPADSYSDDPVYGSPYDPYGGRSSGFGAGDMAYPSGGFSDRISDPYGDDPSVSWGSESRYGRAQGGGYHSYPGVGEGAPYGRNGAPRFDGPGGGTNGYAGGWGSKGGLPPAAVRGYRFRGDGFVDDGAWSAPGRRNGYRFRPLTEQERERRDSVGGWRPRELERSGERPVRRDPPPAEEAYGFESDNWFSRYYRRRP